MYRIAPNTRQYPAAAAIAMAAFVLLAVVMLEWSLGAATIATIGALLSFVMLVVFLIFYRDPERTIAAGVVSPADGKVMAVEDRDGSWYVAIFMDPTNVHVNRAPLAGEVISVEHRPGGYLPAFKKESDRNERFVWHFATEHGDLELTQIAGAVARRIVPYLQAGVKVEKGQRIGIIKFGSRVDFILPGAGLTPVVSVGDKVLAGSTTLLEVA